MKFVEWAAAYLSSSALRVFVGVTPRWEEGCADLECFSSSDIAALNLSEQLLCQLPCV